MKKVLLLALLWVILFATATMAVLDQYSVKWAILAWLPLFMATFYLSISWLDKRLG